MILTIDWPSQSSDLNPIEKLWSILDGVLKDGRPQNENELLETLQNAWNEFDITILSNLVDSMAGRIAEDNEAKVFQSIIKLPFFWIFEFL